jgi:hypothetical protein
LEETEKPPQIPQISQNLKEVLLQKKLKQVLLEQYPND